jgi:hypothetical protein
MCLRPDKPCAAFPLTWHASSLKVVSKDQCSEFSMPQWSLTADAKILALDSILQRKYRLSLETFSAISLTLSTIPMVLRPTHFSVLENSSTLPVGWVSRRNCPVSFSQNGTWASRLIPLPLDKRTRILSVPMSK